MHARRRQSEELDSFEPRLKERRERRLESLSCCELCRRDLRPREQAVTDRVAEQRSSRRVLDKMAVRVPSLGRQQIAAAKPCLFPLGDADLDDLEFRCSECVVDGSVDAGIDFFGRESEAADGLRRARGYLEAGRYPDTEWNSDLTTLLLVKALG